MDTTTIVTVTDRETGRGYVLRACYSRRERECVWRVAGGLVEGRMFTRCAASCMDPGRAIEALRAQLGGTWDVVEVGTTTEAGIELFAR